MLSTQAPIPIRRVLGWLWPLLAAALALGVRSVVVVEPAIWTPPCKTLAVVSGRGIILGFDRDERMVAVVLMSETDGAVCVQPQG
ncbi:hypothetical protein LLH03_16140, partial [bacterium]|nr:hypothetical protein [bacterium]